LASYNLLLGTSATALSKVANIPAPATSYAFKGLVPGTYWFAVQAVSTSEGASANSTSPSLTITKAVVSPSAPTSVTVTAIVTVP
jgi:predicted phage tail protein